MLKLKRHLLKLITFGQVMMLILLLLTAIWLSLTSGRNILAGIFLGFLFALKLYGWPIAVFLILRRKFEPVVWAGIVFLVLNLIVAAWLGFAPLKQYLPVAREIEYIYRAHPMNFSLLAQGTNLLGQWFGMSLLVMGLARLSVPSPGFRSRFHDHDCRDDYSDAHFMGTLHDYIGSRTLFDCIVERYAAPREGVDCRSLLSRGS